MLYTAPNQPGSSLQLRPVYGNFIDGAFLPPVDERYFEAVSPVDGRPYARIPRSTLRDVNLALDAAHRAFPTWSRSSASERSLILLKIADRIEQNLERLALVETWGNGKPIRESLGADLPLVVDHFRYFAGVIRADEGGIAQLDNDTLSYHLREPLGVVGQIIPWNFPLLMAAWKLAPALAAGNCVVLKPAEQTPVSILVLAELIADLLPKGVFNIVNGFGPEAGQALATSPRIAKVAFTGEAATGRLILKYAAENLIPTTLELGGKSPNIFCSDIFDQDDAFIDRAIEGFTMFAFNQGEVCTSPSRALIQEAIYDRFMERALKRVSTIKVGNPLDTTTMMGAQASPEQMDKIMSYVAIGKNEGARLLHGGELAKVAGLEAGFYLQPTVFLGTNNMRLFQEEIFGPVVAVTTFKDREEAVKIANHSLYGLGAGLWTRSLHAATAMSRDLQAGRVWVNCYHLYPAHAAFGGYKQSGFGRENHKMMLDHYTQTKNLIISSAMAPTGLF